MASPYNNDPKASQLAEDSFKRLHDELMVGQEPHGVVFAGALYQGARAFAERAHDVFAQPQEPAMQFSF